MAVLDLQGMQPPDPQHGGGSKGSKGCGVVVITGGGGGGPSHLSLLLC